MSFYDEWSSARINCENQSGKGQPFKSLNGKWVSQIYQNGSFSLADFCGGVLKIRCA